jgi:hypothetical protein
MYIEFLTNSNPCSGCKRTEIIELIRVKTVKPVQGKKLHAENLNTENMIQNICLFDSQLLMLMGKGGHSFYFVQKFRLQTATSRRN